MGGLLDVAQKWLAHADNRVVVRFDATKLDCKFYYEFDNEDMTFDVKACSGHKRKFVDTLPPSSYPQDYRAVDQVWLQLPDPTNCEINVDDADNFASDIDEFDTDADTDDEKYDDHLNSKFEVFIEERDEPTIVEYAQMSLHDAVYKYKTSNLANAFMCYMHMVYEWSPKEFCSAFENTCKARRFSLAVLMWDFAPSNLHATLAKCLCFAFESNNIQFLEFAWDHASRQMREVVPTAARLALQYHLQHTWKFLYDKQLLTNELLFCGIHKLWHKLCYAPPNFLRLVWKDTSSWHLHFAWMLDIALQANKRWVLMFLSKQNITIDQAWLRRSIVKLTSLNLPCLLEMIHEPQTLPLQDVQECYAELFKYSYLRIRDTWWDMYPLTRKQLLDVPNFEWHKLDPSWMCHLWSERKANAHELRAYLQNKRKTEAKLFTFDLDNETVRILNQICNMTKF